MKHLSVFSAFAIAFLSLGIFSCEKDAMVMKQATPTLSVDDRAPVNCFNFKASDEVALGCACMPAPGICPPGMPDFCNFGAKTFPVTVGNYEGYMTSIATGLEQMGNPPTGNGALKLTLVHYFVSNDGNHAFWTEDQAVCAPAGKDPSVCIVNDVLNIAGGCGDFEGASGKFHNHGVLTFDGGGELCPIFYLNGGQDYVPTGTLKFSIFGRICGPNLN